LAGLTLHPAGSYFRLHAAETALPLALTAVVAAQWLEADASGLVVAVLLGVLLYGAIEVIGDRDSIPRGSLRAPPVDASVEDPKATPGVRLLALAVATAVVVGALAEWLEEGAAFAIVPLVAAESSLLARLALVRRWEARHDRQVLYGVDSDGDDRLYARPRPLSIGI
jgi:hypothetical protein